MARKATGESRGNYARRETRPPQPEAATSRAARGEATGHSFVFRYRYEILAAVASFAAGALMLLPRVAQNPAYHNFADTERVLGIPNGWNVLSNIPFAIVGLWGLTYLLRRSDRFVEARERWTYIVFFAGVALTRIGSAYYHLAPSNATLVWDRAPISIGFMGLVAALVAERMRVRAGLALLPFLLIAGFASVWYWQFSESAGAGDLRPYLFVQFFPLLVLPLVLWLFPPRYTRGGDFLVALGLYLVAAMFDLYDRPFSDISGVIGGHPLKHVVAAAGAWWLLRMLRLRVPARG